MENEENVIPVPPIEDTEVLPAEDLPIEDLPKEEIINDSTNETDYLSSVIENQEKLMEFLNPEGKDKETLLQEIKDNQKLLEEQQKYELDQEKEFDKFQTDLLKSQKDLNDTLAEYIKVNEENNEGSTNNIATVIEKMDNLIEGQSYLITGSNTIISYGILYIPFAIICFLLWRFFATFLRQAR